MLASHTTSFILLLATITAQRFGMSFVDCETGDPRRTLDGVGEIFSCHPSNDS